MPNAGQITFTPNEPTLRVARKIDPKPLYIVLMINPLRTNGACWRQQAAAVADLVSPTREYRIKRFIVFLLDVLVVPIEGEVANGR
jgi:hypothetical protein